MTGPDFDHAKVRNAGDHMMPHGFARDRNTGRPPEGTVYLYQTEHGAQVADARGQRFRVMGYGAVQGTVTLRDRHRRMFYADVLLIVRETGR